LGKSAWRGARSWIEISPQGPPAHGDRSGNGSEKDIICTPAPTGRVWTLIVLLTEPGEDRLRTGKLSAWRLRGRQRGNASHAETRGTGGSKTCLLNGLRRYPGQREEKEGAVLSTPSLIVVRPPALRLTFRNNLATGVSERLREAHKRVESKVSRTRATGGHRLRGSACGGKQGYFSLTSGRRRNAIGSASKDGLWRGPMKGPRLLP